MRWTIVAALPAFVQLIRPAHLCNCAQTSNTVDLFPHWCKGCFGEVWHVDVCCQCTNVVWPDLGGISHVVGGGRKESG